MEMSKVKLEQSAYSLNDEIAYKNKIFFKELGLTVFNMISSPGSGKTTILESLAKLIGDKLFVITGDIQTQLDKDRIERAGAKAYQLETHGSCHLSAKMISDTLKKISLYKTEYLIIENVGNLVCPSSFYLGEDEKIAVLSVTEGDEKPIKYPGLFIRASLVIISKIDLLPYVKFDLNRAESDIKKLKSDAEIIKTSYLNNDGINLIFDYMKKIKNKKFS
jgi:hydrogenase nickel incorporation protein HypB